MLKQFTTAQKRGMLIVLGGLILLAGWRWRASHVTPASETPPTTTSAQASQAHRIDLNTADTTVLQQVQGIGAASARRIVRYRSLIGGYTHTEQLLKVWGISQENFVRIEEQVYVDTTTAAFAALRKAKPQHQGFARDFKPRYPQNTYPAQVQNEHNPPPAIAGGIAHETPPASPAPTPRKLLDINTADSTALLAISGIGPGTARNILKYRSLIYFFHSLDQLNEVWGIRPENLERMLPYLTVGDSRKNMPHLRINEMSVDEMGRHKYIGFKEAKIIVAYRTMHGPFADFAALNKVQEIAPEKWEQLRPYLVF